ncbi:MAG: succinyl-diaminopimelate desuccinylase [Alphaproteobacteria bacterium]|nr:succinyl-diaminopimelate desuccinylase [Alphaproteobacteria bacterium]OJV13145.1 MAG: succinyl-diaminopimelate desuccinylase [Alphaproteobacteria bacterium 33-17]
MDDIELLKKLISFNTVSPSSEDSIDFLKDYLEDLGFNCKKIESKQGFNLYAEIGRGVKHLAFAGHMDVVPAGDGWIQSPFEALEQDKSIIGRGAVDMKGAIASFVSAAREFIEDADATKYKMSLLISNDEEITNNYGTPAILDYLAKSSINIDLCIVGEPTNPNIMGEMAKIGRRGSASFDIKIIGKQGHAAYPENAINPMAASGKIAYELSKLILDNGDENFSPSNLEVTSIETGNESRNTIPGSCTLKCNVRYNPQQSPESLKNIVEKIVQDNIGNCKYSIESLDSARPFITNNQAAINVINEALFKVNGLYPKLSTTGGTSDARFIAQHFPVIEYGLVNKTAHQVNEATPIADIKNLTESYAEIIKRFYDMA